MFQQIKTLTKINLLFANPQATQRARDKGKVGAALIRSILAQYLVSGLIFSAAYGFILSLNEFHKNPALFTYYMGLFMLLGLSQAMTSILNIFLESHDLPAYLPLPFDQRAIFMAKLAVVSLTVVPYLLPILLLYLITAIRSGMFIILAIVVALVLFSIATLIVYLVASIIIFGLAKTPFYRKHKKIVTTALLVVTMVLVVGSILFLNTSMSVDDLGAHYPAIVFLLPFYQVTTQLMTMTGLYSLLGILACLGILYSIVRQFILRRFYEDLVELSSIKGEATRKNKSNQSLARILWSYNMQLIKEPNLLFQVMSGSLLFPLVLLISFGFNGVLEFSTLPIRFAFVLFLGGGLFSYFITNSMSIVAIGISLDKENFEYIQTTPIAMRLYFKHKFLFGWVIQLGLIAVITVLLVLVTKLNLWLALSFLIGASTSSYVISNFYFWRDLRLLDSHWTDLSQLFTRGAGTFGTFFFQVFGGIVGAMLIGAAVWITFLLPMLWVQVMLFGVSLLALFAGVMIYYKKYWSHIS